MKLFYVVPDGKCKTVLDVANSSGNESASPELFNFIAGLVGVTTSIKELANCHLIGDSVSYSFDEAGNLTVTDSDSEVVEKGFRLKLENQFKDELAGVNLEVLISGLLELGKVKAGYAGDILKAAAPDVYKVIVGNIVTKASVVKEAKAKGDRSDSCVVAQSSEEIKSLVDYLNKCIDDKKLPLWKDVSEGMDAEQRRAVRTTYIAIAGESFPLQTAKIRYLEDGRLDEYFLKLKQNLTRVKNGFASKLAEAVAKNPQCKIVDFNFNH
ncbi:hypothetical protein [Buttiauxella noackiae]|uniref:hypothetical protein n=1 Tax=Buttiauxella noackiae TaxID=82992 RepID=UPI0005517A1F|nr:hypothetical protein [Buttiauxella noackiae]